MRFIGNRLQPNRTSVSRDEEGATCEPDLSEYRDSHAGTPSEIPDPKP